MTEIGNWEILMTHCNMAGEPTAQRTAIPAILVAFLAAVIYFGDVFILERGGELDARVYFPFQSVNELDNLQPLVSRPPWLELGRVTYKNACAACHQDDGAGNSAMFVPPLAGSEWVIASDPAILIRIVLVGFEGPITVNRRLYGKAFMPSRREVLSDEEIAAVLSYIRNSWGNSGSVVTGADVRNIRQRTSHRSNRWTDQELLPVSLGE